MKQKLNEFSNNQTAPLADWHRKLLAWAAILTVLLVGVGGILCVTQSIRSCPDWPGCFGKLIPPPQASPILEYSHRVLAASTGLLILASAIAGLVRARRRKWILIPPLIACVLVVEVSYFGARVVLGNIAAGWAAVDLGSALLVVALMITAAVSAQGRKSQPGRPDKRRFSTPFARLLLTTVLVVYIVFVSGVLVAGKGSISACLGWPVYSPGLIQLDAHGVGNILRLALSAAGLGLILAVIWQAWRRGKDHPRGFRYTGWAMAAFLLEVLIQVLLLIFGFKVVLLIPYTLSAAVLWGTLVAMAADFTLEEEPLVKLH